MSLIRPHWILSMRANQIEFSSIFSSLKKITCRSAPTEWRLELSRSATSGPNLMCHLCQVNYGA